MKPNDPDDSIIQLLDSAIETGDCSLLLQKLTDNSCDDKIHPICLKLGADIAELSNGIPETDDIISNSLQVLLEMSRTVRISAALSLYLSRTILLLIIEENCSINNIKTGINVLNEFIQQPSTMKALVHDESLEGSLQILGRKIPDIGDYECQCCLFEALYRLTYPENMETWASIWFPDTAVKTMFLNLDPQKFELNCRTVLNYINRNEPDRKVFSYIANYVCLGSFQLQEPYGSEFWVDFNYGSKSISFYHSELSGNKTLDDSIMWETISINNSCVRSYILQDNIADNTREATLFLNCPCHTLMNSSDIIKSSFNSYEIKLSFCRIYDIQQHLKMIYGEIFSNEAIPQRKVSTSVPISIDTCEDKIFLNEAIPQRKVSTSVPISIDTCEDKFIIPETEEAQRLNKCSHSAEIIRISIEDNVNTEGNEIPYEEEAHCSKTFPKTQSRKIRLYNLDSAPVYDVPPFSSNSLLTENNTSNKVMDEHPTDISGSTVLNSKLYGTDDSDIHRNSNFVRKRKISDVENTNQSPLKDKHSTVYDIITGSDDDFVEQNKRDFSNKRKRSVTSRKEGKTKKRRYNISHPNDSQTIESGKSQRTPRKAAIKAKRVNKRILDPPEVVYDAIEALNESFDDVILADIPKKKKRYSKAFNPLQTDTETGSSEVSWLKQKHPLFESPKKNYSEWRKSQRSEKKHPVEKTVSHLKSPIRKTRLQRRKKNVNHNISVRSGSTLKSLGFSQFEHFNLTIEKVKKTHCGMKALEIDLRSISTSSNLRKKCNQSYINHNGTDSDLNLNNNAQSNAACEETDIYKENPTTNIDFTDAFPTLPDNSKDKDICSTYSDKLHYQEHICEGKQILEKTQDLKHYTSPNITGFQNNIINSSIPIASSSELDKFSLRRNETEYEINYNSNCACTDKSEANDSPDTHNVMLPDDEKDGKNYILQLFIKDLAALLTRPKWCYPPPASKFSALQTPCINSKFLKSFSLDAFSLRKTFHPACDGNIKKSVDVSDVINSRKQKNAINVEDLIKSKKARAKCRQQKKSRVTYDNSFNSFCSKATTVSFQEMEKDRKWFSEITFTLSQDADNLTRKFLGTVQRCFCEYSAKMCLLRENIVKAAVALEMPSNQNLKPCKLRKLIKSCTIIRIEVEKSLKEMQYAGKVYFEAEEKYYRKLKHKHRKATKKYLSSMNTAEKVAIQKLERNILLKTKFFFKKYLKDIDSA